MTSSDGIDRTIAEKERGLLEQDYATPCPKCGGVVFEWWDSDTCRDCEDSTNETATEQTTLMTDGGTVKDGLYQCKCVIIGCDEQADTSTKYGPMCRADAEDL